MFYYYLGAITFALAMTRAIWFVIDRAEHSHKTRKHRR